MLFRIKDIANFFLSFKTEYILQLFYNLLDVNNILLQNTIINDNNININYNKGYLIMCNHPSFLDFAIIKKYFPNCYCITDNVDNTIFTDDEYINLYHIVPFHNDRKNGKDDLKNLIVKLINENKQVLIFPEGEFESEGKVIPFKHGIFYLALQHNFNIILCSINIKSNFKDKLLQSICYTIQIPVAPPAIKLQILDIIESIKYHNFNTLYDYCFYIISNSFNNGNIE